MSLFKAREFWVTHCTDDERFDQNCLKVSRLNTDFEYIITGSHSGVLRIFASYIDFDGFKPTDGVLEKNLSQPILQLETGRLVSGSLKTQLCVLFPRSIAVYSLQSKEGATQHGNQYSLQLMYEHKLKRTVANITLGPFGGTQNRDFVCVQSLDGMLTFFEQESFAFCCFLPDFLLPGPIAYVQKTDSFVTSSSNWRIESYRYKRLSESGQNTDQNDEIGRKVESSWSFNLSEPVLGIKVLCDMNKSVSIMVLGERNLYCLGENGRQKFMKRLDYSPICFTAYILDDDKILSLIISETSTLLIYQSTTLKWSAQLTFAPVAINRAFLENIRGALVLLSEEGLLQCCYLGTDPSIFTAPPLTNRELDFEKTDNELATLNKIIQNSYAKDLSITNVSSEKDLSITVVTNQKLELCKFERKSKLLEAFMCAITVKVTPKMLFEEVQVAIFVHRPLKAEPSVVFFNNLQQEESFECFIFVDEDSEVPSLHVEIVASCILGTGMPTTITKNSVVPMKLVYETCQAEKDSKNKIILNINQAPLPLSNLFEDFIEEESAGNNAVGFKNKFNNTVVSILTAKSSQRYRLQSDSLASLNIVVQQMVDRLKLRYANNKEFTITYTSSLPIAQVVGFVNEHFETRQKFNNQMANLNQLGAQFRLIQKRLIAKFKTKNPTPLTNLELLMDDTLSEILKVTESLDDAIEALKKSQTRLSCVLNLITNLVKMADVGDDVLSLTESTFSNVYDVEGQNWEDTLDASLCYLLRTVLAKSEKDKLRPAHTSFEEIKDIEKVEKHLTHVLERLMKKQGPVLETHFDVNAENKIESNKTENAIKLVPIGSQIAESSSRALSARKSLLRRRQMVQENQS